MEALGHGAEHLAQSHGLRGGEAQRPDHLLFGQAEQLAGRRRGAEHAHRAGDVPAHVVVRGIDGVADAAFDFDAEHQGVQEIAPADRAVLGQRQDGRGHRTGGMDDGPQVRVVEIEDVRADAVHQRGVQHVHAFVAAEHGGLRGPGEWRERGDRDVDGLVARSADRAADPVQQGAGRLLAHGGREIFRRAVTT